MFASRTFSFSKIDFQKFYLFQFDGNLNCYRFGSCRDWLVCLMPPFGHLLLLSFRLCWKRGEFKSSTSLWRHFSNVYGFIIYIFWKFSALELSLAGNFSESEVCRENDWLYLLSFMISLGNYLLIIKRVNSNCNSSVYFLIKNNFKPQYGSDILVADRKQFRLASRCLKKLSHLH